VSAHRIAACTDDSKLILIEGGDILLEMSYVLPAASGSKNVPSSITNVATYPGGILATLASGNVVMFERVEEEYVFRKAREYACEASPANGISIAPDGEHVVCSMHNGQLYTFSLGNDQGRVGESRCASLLYSLTAWNHNKPNTGRRCDG
jgi:hypothetical protein